jgi:hypothetical protein
MTGFRPNDRLTLRGIKRAGGTACVKFSRFLGHKVLIRSGEHSAWWRPDAAGYTDDRTQAGIYDFLDAYERTVHCGREKRISYVLAIGHVSA